MKHDYFMVWHESHLVNLQHSPIEWRLHNMNFKDCIFIFGQDIGNNSNTVLIIFIPTEPKNAPFSLEHQRNEKITVLKVGL